MTQMTVEQAFMVAIEVERKAEQLYHSLSAKFVHHPDVADFWNIFAADEAKHVEWLEKTRSKMRIDQLAVAVDEETTVQLETARRFSAEKALQGVKNLEDAYILVNDIENGETNAIFKFLLNNFEADQRTVTSCAARSTNISPAYPSIFQPTTKGSSPARLCSPWIRCSKSMCCAWDTPITI